MHPLIQLKKATPIFVIASMLACFGLAPIAQAVSPPPDGGYPNNNTAEGEDALFSLTTGGANTATGASALFGNTTGNDNTATGSGALVSNTTGGSNTATGASALFANTTGSDNTATGAFALQFDTTGGSNTANGFEALFDNITGNDNTATGAFALESNTTGNDNTATGSAALVSNTTGGSNTANGFEALESNTTGSGNTANGFQALFHNTIGSNNVALGYSAGSALTTGSNNINIGNVGVAGESAKIRIGTVGAQTKTFIAGIHGVPVTGAAVFVSSSGQLGTTTSSARFKDEIKLMDNASEALYALKPVTFRYKKGIDPKGLSQFGLVAEEVEAVNPDLVVRDKGGKPYSVRYDQVNAMLLNEFLKEHKTVQEQGATMTQQGKDFEAAIAQQQKQIEALTATVKQQAAQIQKVSAQLEVSKAAPQVAENNH